MLSYCYNVSVVIIFSKCHEMTNLLTLGCTVAGLCTHRASLVAMHGEVRAEEQVSDSQEQRLCQWSSSVIIIQLICLERMDKIFETRSKW